MNRPILHRAAYCALIYSLVAFFGTVCAQQDTAQSNSNAVPDHASRPNVLFIVVDDLRPALHCYGDQLAKTDNIDRLASRGVLFRRAYCQQAVCSPSRASVITGLRPDTLRVWDLRTHFRAAVPDVITLPQLFKNSGYITQSIGKILHGTGRGAKDPPSWSLPPQYDNARAARFRYAAKHNLKGKGLKREAYESPDVPDNQYVDGMVTDAAIAVLRSQTEEEHPFFLAVGFRKPHVPFCAPKKYWDLYDSNAFRNVVNPSPPKGAPELAQHNWPELRGYTDIPKQGPLAPEKITKLRHGYYACVSYIDAQIGRLLDELDRQQLTNQTIVVLWSDHGYHLGEHDLWCKTTNYELDTRVPLIIAAPNGSTEKSITSPERTSTSDALVELVDIYPTLAELCHLPAPKNLAGTSLVPCLKNVNARVKSSAFSQFPRPWFYSKSPDIMGYAVRTEQFRYVEWRRHQRGEVVARELYDHHNDPHETTNLADLKANSETLRTLSRLLPQHR